MVGFLFAGGTTPPFFNVRNYGAFGDGTHDDTAAIQACMAAAWAAGSSTLSNQLGATVFFPPGSYLVSSPLTDAAAGAANSIELVGSGPWNTMISGTVNGYVIDKTAPSFLSISRIAGLGIINNTSTTDTGAVRIRFSQSLIMEDCAVGGFWAINAGDNQFANFFNGISWFAPGNQKPGTIGLIIAQDTCVACNVLGYDVGIQVGGTTANGTQDAGANGFALVGCRTETCTTGVLLGKNTRGNSSGSGGTIISLTSERCGTTLNIDTAAGLVIFGGSFTGSDVGAGHSLGPPRNISTISTPSGGNSTVTVSGYTLNDYGWTSSTRPIYIESSTNTGYNTTSGYVTGTWQSSTTFSYPVAGSPGAYTGGATWSFEQQYGINFSHNAEEVFVAGVVISQDSAVKNIDMSANVGGAISFWGVKGGGGAQWGMPSSGKAGYYFGGGSDNPVNTMLFADLPASPIEGDRFYITNSTATAWGAAAATGGSTHGYVGWNGTAWTQQTK